MTRSVVDARALLHVVEHEVQVHEAQRLVAPSAVRSQALQLLLDDVLAGRRTEREARALHDRTTEVKIRALGDRVSRWTSWQVAREQGWTSLRHAEYVAVTRLQADVLVALDPALVEAARGLVPLADVESLSSP
ncbi:hypothetical protein [Angustibacter aerolatus]